MGVVARGQLDDSRDFKLTLDFVKRGRERYNIYCTPCHGHTGAGDGMAVRRGFRKNPPSFHIDRLKAALDEHFYDVITNGFGAMNDYAAQISARDRWAIITYIRALQLSQSAGAAVLSGEDRRRLEGGKP
jgi:hypothetical protein